MSPGPTAAPRGPDDPLERAQVRPGRGLDATTDADGGPIEGIVDRVLDDHQAVMAALKDDVRIPIAGIPEGPVSLLRRERAALASLKEDLAAPEDPLLAFEVKRRERERLVADLKPTDGPVIRADPLVTRVGVLHVEADFTQARGLDAVVEARLYRHGVRTTRAFLDLKVDELAQLAGIRREAAQHARDDLDLERIPGLGADAADVLRVAGIHSLSDLAGRDASLLAKRLTDVRTRHHLVRLPEPIASEAAVARIVAEARTLSGGV